LDGSQAFIEQCACNGENSSRDVIAAAKKKSVKDLSGLVDSPLSKTAVSEVSKKSMTTFKLPLAIKTAS
jgi:hypothetical protein